MTNVLGGNCPWRHRKRQYMPIWRFIQLRLTVTPGVMRATWPGIRISESMTYWISSGGDTTKHVLIKRSHNIVRTTLLKQSFYHWNVVESQPRAVIVNHRYTDSIACLALCVRSVISSPIQNIVNWISRAAFIGRHTHTLILYVRASSIMCNRKTAESVCAVCGSLWEKIGRKRTRERERDKERE